MKRSADEPPGESRDPKRGPGARLRGDEPGWNSKTRPSNNDALSYLRKVKSVFTDRREIYEQFLEIMKDFKNGKLTTRGVIERVKRLFKGHPDLILGFNTFLPHGYEITRDEIPQGSQIQTGSRQSQQEPTVEFSKAIQFVNKIKRTFANDERVYKSFLDILNKYRKNSKTIRQVYEEVAVLFEDHHELLEEFATFLPDYQLKRKPAGPAAGRSKASRSARGMHEAFADMEREEAEKEKKRSKERDRRRRRVATSRKNALTIRHDAEDSAEQMASERIAQRPRDAVERLAPNFTAHLREVSVFDKMKMKLRSSNTYYDLLKCIKAFNNRVFTKMELESFVYDLLGKHQDLYSGFMDLILKCETLDWDTMPPSEDTVSQEDVNKLLPILGREEYLKTPASELDLSACDISGKSYRLLPPEFPRMPASGMTSLCQRVLNEDWVNVTSGSEDYSYRSMRKNQYEEALFRCEDDRFELDMVIETTRSTINRLEQIQQKISRMSSEQRAAFVLNPEDLNLIHVRPVERIYGDNRLEVREMLFKSPVATIPVVLMRLNQKLDEWERLWKEMQPVWSKVYEKNYSRSLDHRSFYFKQEDKGRLSAKQIVKKVRESADERRRAAVEDPAKANADDIVFHEKGKEVHDDAYAILSFYCSLQLSPDQADKMLRLWRTFVEPFYGVHRDSDGSAIYDSLAEEAIGLPQGRHQHENAQEAEEGNVGMQQENEDDNQQMPTPPHQTDAPSGSEDEQGNQAKGGRDEDGEEVDAEETAEDEEGGEDAHCEKRYRGCKPLGRTMAVSGNPSGEGALESIFYGHDLFYVSFRLHSYLLERLAVARDSAKQAETSGSLRSDAEGHEGLYDAREVLSQFYHLLSNFLANAVESTTFEDDCRSLLGANSYVLFTLDKLVQKIFKQLQTLQNDDTSIKLFQLREYEASRSSMYDENVYMANACMLLNNDEACYRIHSIDSGEDCRDVGVRMVDHGPDKSELPSGILDSRFSKYLRSFVTSGASIPESTASPLYMERNLPVSKGTEAMQGVHLLNGLECKICCATAKASYVLDTEDVFFRPQQIRWKARGELKRKGGLPVVGRNDNFRRWWEQRLHEMPQEENEPEEEEQEKTKDEVDASEAAEVMAGATAQAGPSGVA